MASDMTKDITKTMTNSCKISLIYEYDSHGYGRYLCSKCGYDLTYYLDRFNFCPKCGCFINKPNDME